MIYDDIMMKKDRREAVLAGKLVDEYTRAVSELTVCLAEVLFPCSLTTGRPRIVPCV